MWRFLYSQAPLTESASLDWLWFSPSLWQYIVAGSLTVAAGKYDSRCLVNMLLSLFYIGVKDPGVWWFLSPCSQVNGALAVSIVTTVISLTAAILHGLDTAGILIHCTGMCYQYRVCYFSWLKPQCLWIHIFPIHLYWETDSILRIRMFK